MARIRPTDVGPWDIVTRVLGELGQVDVGSTPVLEDEPRETSVYELHSIRMSMSLQGTAILASMGMTDGPIVGTITNDDRSLMEVSSEVPPTGPAPQANLYWHVGRSQQNGAGVSESHFYFPPEFYWALGLHGAFQNGSGSNITFMWTVIFRVVRFSRNDFPQVISKLPPLTAHKQSVFT